MVHLNCGPHSRALWASTEAKPRYLPQDAFVYKRCCPEQHGKNAKPIDNVFIGSPRPRDVSTGNALILFAMSGTLGAIAFVCIEAIGFAATLAYLG